MRLRVFVVMVMALGAMLGGGMTAHAGSSGTDWVASDNVRWIGEMRNLTPGVGGRVVGNYLYVTSSKGLYIFDISQPTSPVLVSSLTVDVHWENEEVPTNGRILGISDEHACTAPPTGGYTGTPSPTSTANCLTIYDVTDKANPRVLTSIWNAGPHTSSCVLDCQYMWGSDGTITDLRHVLDPGHPAPIIGNWLKGSPATSAHHQQEVRPGVVLTATDPILLLSVNAEDGGTPAKPVLLATGTPPDNRFIHSVRWPNLATDPIMLAGGETNFNERCIQVSGAFTTWDTSDVYRDGKTIKGGKFHMLDEYRVTTGTYTDGNPPVTALGCSVHWFEAHPTFHGSGLVASAAYDNGTRFLRVAPNGKISEVGWFEPIAGGTSAVHWAPDGKTIYAIDYQRGMDILQWTGPTYAPATSAAGASITSAAPAPNLPNTAGGLALAGAPLLGAGLGLLGLSAVLRRRRAA